jgi:hypothetical protein
MYWAAGDSGDYHYKGFPLKVKREIRDGFS